MEALDPDAVDIAYVMTGSLKRCPFCGGRPITANRVNEATGIYRGLVHCTGCTATIGYNARTKDEARTGAVARWEKRMGGDPCL